MRSKKSKNRAQETVSNLLRRKLSLNNPFVKAYLLVWFINSCILVSMNLTRIKRYSASFVATFVVGTAFVTFLNIYIATCLYQGNCKTVAYLFLIIGFAFLSTAALWIN
jgi:hypothetical protein